jgi:hypothetical protein
MGGAIAIRIANASLIPNILAVSAIDVVEGSAIASLNVMHQFLRDRPQFFFSNEKAIEWCVKNRVTSNLRAARGLFIYFLILKFKFQCLQGLFVTKTMKTKCLNGELIYPKQSLFGKDGLKDCQNYF